MKTVRIIATGILAIGLAGAATAAHHEDLMAEVTAIGDVLAEAMLANDAETMLAMYSEDAISLPNYGPRMEGMETFRQHHEQMAAAGMKVLEFSSDPTEVWPAGDHVIEIGTFEIELEMPGMPGPVQDKGKYMTVYVRDADGALKIKAETWNTDINPMAAMGGGHGHDDDHHHPHEHGDSDSDSDSEKDEGGEG